MHSSFGNTGNILNKTARFDIKLIKLQNHSTNTFN